MRRVNVFDDECPLDGDEPGGYVTGAIRISKVLGAQSLALKAFEVGPGQSICPYHYEYEEEWLLVLDGSLLVRTPEGEESLDAGEIVCFQPGPAGAHKVSNRGAAPVRAIMFSSAREPAVAVYPDSDKIGVWPGNEADNVMLRRSGGAVDYWDGERSL
jgi:uncharacterized cupin superfamily protein